MEDERIILEVCNPVSVAPTKYQNAPRLNDLNGKTICEWISKRWQLGKPGDLTSLTGHWREGETFPMMEELLKKQFPDIKIIPGADLPGYEDFSSQFQRGDWSVQDKLDQVTAAMKENGCDAVILGNGA
jgi:hypothetical protein